MLDIKTAIPIEGIDPAWTDRIHSGAMKAVWNRETNELPTVERVPPQRGLKSELVDGKWVWVVGCKKCLGEETSSSMNYHCCHEHDRCVTCNKHRTEIKESPWGVTGGWRCSPCQTALDEKRKQEALQRVAESEYDPWDYKLNDKVVCPHCASSYEPDEEPSSKDTCDTCGGEFKIEINYSVTYCTEVIGERLLPDEV